MNDETKKNQAALQQDHAISAEYTVRCDKVARMRQSGIEPWPAPQAVTATCAAVIAEYTGEGEYGNYAVSGRLLTIREHGKTLFGTIQDASGKLQIYLRKDEVGDEQFGFFKEYIDVGDIVWFAGPSFRTKMGEVTVKVDQFKLLSKCLHPLPEKFHGLVDIETIYRQRYLDLITNSESKKRFIQRSQIIAFLRRFLDDHQYTEVETPMLHPIPGGAAARPFVTHHNALDSDFYLRIAPELYLKRLVVGGMERVYEINRNFRNEGISTRHNPEFTMLEYYTAHGDYVQAMDFLELMLRSVAQQVVGTVQLSYGDHMLDFGKPFERLSMYQAVLHYGAMIEKELHADHIDATLQRHNLKLDNVQAPWGYKLLALFEALVEPKLIQPTFIIDFPIEVSPLSKRTASNNLLAARFELFVAGMELSNGFNELNDPFDQAERFKEQAQAHASGDSEAHHYDADYILALEYGLAPTVGVGIGIDRLAMLLTSTTSIKDVILFPTLRKKE